MNITNEIRTQAQHRLAYASVFMSNLYNSISSITEGNTRLSIHSARNLAENGIKAVHLHLGRKQLLEPVEPIDSAYFAAVDQIRLFERLLRLNWPNQFDQFESGIENNSLVRDSINTKYSRQHAKKLLKNIEAENKRHIALFLRSHAAMYLLKQSAYLLGLDPMKTMGQRILREISFPPEIRQAGLGILSYFAEIIEKKYPAMDVGVTIEQRHDRVILLIETPDGQRDKIEQELSNYGLVVTGQMKPEDYLQDSIEIMKLNHRLEIANLELRQTKELLYSERSQFEKRINSLEEQAEFLREIFDKDKYIVNHVIDGIKQLSIQVSNTSATNLDKLLSLIEKGKLESDQNAVLDELQQIRGADPTIFEKLHDLLIKGAIQGAAGNYLFKILESLSKYG